MKINICLFNPKHGLRLIFMTAFVSFSLPAASVCAAASSSHLPRNDIIKTKTVDLHEHFQHPYFDQWAFRGTYINGAIDISDMNYLSLEIPVSFNFQLYEIELKSGGVVLATAMIDTLASGILSEDGQWKKLVSRIDVVSNGSTKLLNYVAVVIHDPRYRNTLSSVFRREGTVKIRNMTLHQDPDPSWYQAGRIMREYRDYHDAFELIHYWKASHGGLRHIKNESTGAYSIQGGTGWKGGYLPSTDLAKFKYFRLKIRNPSRECNRVFIELKHEQDQLLGLKAPLVLPWNDSSWTLFEIELPQEIRIGKPLNYFAVSDPYLDFEIGSISLANSSLEGLEVHKVRFSTDQRLPRPDDIPRCRG